MFAQYVRQGNAGRGKQVQVGSVRQALGAIGTTFELDGRDNPTRTAPGSNKYQKRIAQQLEGYRREDPRATSEEHGAPHQRFAPPPADQSAPGNQSLWP